jgi:hypothetical protein
MRSPVPESLAAFASTWREIVRAPRLRATVLAWTFGVFAAMLVARIGTSRARAAAAILLLAGVAITYVLARLEKRTFEDAKRLIDALFRRSDPEIAARAQRALSLAYRPSEGTSEALARLHLSRAMDALPKDRVTRGAQRRAWLFGVVAMLLGALCLGTCGVRGFGIVEGADILVAREGKAPLDFAYLTEPEIVARPPEYLHEPEHRSPVYGDLMLPHGTLITVRGRPVHDGRALLLTDGTTRVPFFDDGSGRLVARWALLQSADLRVAALFGDVLIEEPLTTHVQSIADDPPHVVLEGAPREVKLELDTDVSEIPLRYEATDDHGMREVHLVLRAGVREERRMLAKLDGETRVDRGGSTLRVTDAFVKKSHVPVLVTVEAKDNDAVSGPKWGKSEAIVLIPPAVGEAEAMRLVALEKVRDVYVDALARRLTLKLPQAAPERRKLAETETTASENDREQLYSAVRTSYIGVSVPRRISALLFTHSVKIDKAIGAFSNAPSQTSFDGIVAATEKFVTVLDAVIQGLAQKDARTSAKELADVADDMAAGFSAIDLGAGQGGRARVGASHTVLATGATSLERLGMLGHDLGEITVAYLLRIDRADKEQDLLHAALAARDLAARLQTPDPSVGSHSRAGRAGAESGGTPEQGEEGESGGDEVAQAFEEAARDLNQLALDHAQEMGEIEKASGQTSAQDMKEVAGDLKERAERVRQAVKNLPETGASPETKEGQARAAREQAEQMAKSLEQENIADAVNSGKSAMQHLEEAKRAASLQRLWGGDTGSDKNIDDAAQKLDGEVKSAQRMLDELKKRAEQRATPELGKHAENEGKLGDRMKELGDKSKGGSMPEQAVRDLESASEAAKQAQSALRQGDLKRGKEHQREAQRKLEEAQKSFGDNDEQGRGEGDDGRSQTGEHTDIPTAEAHKGPEEFRRRVLRGLAMPAPTKQQDAIHRYAEGLLK